MHPTNCLNCATILTADDRFCPTCGQRTDTHRLTMPHIWHDLGHAFTHTDRGFFFTIKELAVRPGVVAREYVQGKRKKYFNPFSLLVIVLGIYLVANSIFKPFSPDDELIRRTQSTLRTESQKKKFAIIMERRRKLGEFMNTRTNFVLFVSTPYIAMVMWLLFRRKGYFYAEHLSTLAYVNAFLSILTIIVFGPLLYLARGTPVHTILYGLMMVSHVAYLGLTYHGFLGYTTGRGYLKTMGAAFLAILFWAILSMIVGTLYILAGIY